MQTISNIYQIIGAALFLAYAYNVALLIINQLKTK